ncbi:GNAT family N-acetyltransferase [Sebaldella sp. S0638]|uniref:GNAT family N-acetyltransferase n=1 Tax=Sebaldella sp. S0638 TaxID=2957809 RepID=UPI00209CD4B5|nr:N-acetyltransferase [Sebaldella sp. S0638]MCP1225478.1 N-acetyltransferase [Sebaldella sp. S0638]
MDINIRNEIEKDYREVEELTREAFWNLYVPGANEHFIVHNLRESKSFIKELDFVAIHEDKIVGNIIYTLSYIEDESNKKHEVITFGPVSILPEFQNRGIGRKLIEHSINKAKDLSYKAIIIYGYPDYYSKYGGSVQESL